jgi:hypothetical protein
MVYCSLSLGETIIWSSVPCKTGVNIKTSPYIPFSGNLVFLDTLGSTDPVYTLLGTRYQLVFLSDIAVPGDPTYMQVIPLDAVANQTLKVTLDLQNCTISIFERCARGRHL